MAGSTKVSRSGVWLLLGALGITAAQSASCSSPFHSCYETRTCAPVPHDEAGAAGDEFGGTGGGRAIAGASGSGRVGGVPAEAGLGGIDEFGGSSSGGTDSGGTDGSAARPVGAACSISDDCALGNCIDGVCCEGDCTGCKACAAKLTGKSDGTCAPVVGGQDPHNQCDDLTATNQCGTDGACDGSGECRKVSSSHVCAAASCTGSTFKPVATCDGAGACNTPMTESCGTYPCATTGCAKTCSSQADCSGTSYCKITSGTSGTCMAKNPNGTLASSAFECSSNVVADGVCCDMACTGCRACSGAPLTGGVAGQCLNVVASSSKSCPPASPCKFASACSAEGCTVQQNFQDGSPDPTCASGKPYCFSGGCVACNVDSQCGLPTPSCSGHACVCRKPSSTNKLKNPGFDGSTSTGFSSWTKTNVVLSTDAESCPGSNGVFVENSENDPFQCFALTPGDYFVGGRFKGPSTGSFVRVRFFSGGNCGGNSLGTADLSLSGTIDWTPNWQNFTAPATTMSAYVGVYGIQLSVDQLFVGTAAQF